MANSYMSLIYIDSDDQARKTNLSASQGTDAATWAAFRSYERHRVDIKKARFLIDYHNRKGDLSHTIPIDETGFTAVTGQPPLSEADYRKIDADHWNDVRAAVAA